LCDIYLQDKLDLSLLTFECCSAQFLDNRQRSSWLMISYFKYLSEFCLEENQLFWSLKVSTLFDVKRVDLFNMVGCSWLRCRHLSNLHTREWMLYAYQRNYLSIYNRMKYISLYLSFSPTCIVFLTVILYCSYFCRHWYSCLGGRLTWVIHQDHSNSFQSFCLAFYYFCLDILLCWICVSYFFYTYNYPAID